MENQKLINLKLRLALREGNLPYSFEDPKENGYRKIVYECGRELNKKFTVKKRGNLWIIYLV